MDPHVLFKTEDQERQFRSGKLHPLLLEIFGAAALFALKLGWALLVTEVWRSWQRDKELKGSGTHPSWRAVDIRTNDIDPKKVDALVGWINSKWQYDSLRPWMSVAYHKPHGTGPHIHLQIHPRTKER